MAKRLLSKVTCLYLFLTVLFILTGCSRGDSQSSVTEVIDGDTVILKDSQHLRLIGIDTPEMRTKTPQGFVYAPQPFAVLARTMLERLVLNKEIVIEFDKEEKDKYNRLLGYIFLGEQKSKFVNKELVRQGVAVVSFYPPNIKYLHELLKAQDRARRNGLRLWKQENIIESSGAQDYIGQIRVVRGKVLSTYDSGNTVYLNFGNDYKKDFTVVIFKESRKYFLQEDIVAEKYYLNKRIETAGKIREYNGPEIIVNHPQQIKVIE